MTPNKASSNNSLIAVDIDDVLVPHFQDLIDWYNQQYGTRLELADNHPTDTTNWGTATIEEAVRRVHNFYETPQFKQAKPVAEAKMVLEKLSVDYDLVVITAREDLIEKTTREWLDEHFSELFKQVHLTARYSLEGKSRRKADVCAEIGAKYLIDDDVGNVLGALEVGTKGILFGEFPWGEAEYLPEGITRCRDWSEVQEYFDGLG